jgi:hypothetical protein
MATFTSKSAIVARPTVRPFSTRRVRRQAFGSIILSVKHGCQGHASADAIREFSVCGIGAAAVMQHSRRAFAGLTQQFTADISMSINYSCVPAAAVHSLLSDLRSLRSLDVLCCNQLTQGLITLIAYPRCLWQLRCRQLSARTS